MSEPRCTEVEITASSGGAIQVVKYNLRNDFSFTRTERYTVPEDWSQEQLEEWKATKTQEIKEKVDGLAQIEQDALLVTSDWHGD